MQMRSDPQSASTIRLYQVHGPVLSRASSTHDSYQTSILHWKAHAARKRLVYEG